jgi:hypothetical protein
VWNAVIAGIVFNHPSIASLRRELLRNGELRWVCGFDPGLGAKAVPTKDAFSRFISLLLTHDYFLDEMFHALLEKLGQMLPDLGVKLAVDSKAIESFARPVRTENNHKEPDGRRDVDADWGKKTYQGQRDDGSTWEKVKSWYGYKLHLLVDSIYELPLELLPITEVCMMIMKSSQLLIFGTCGKKTKTHRDHCILTRPRYSPTMNPVEYTVIVPLRGEVRRRSGRWYLLDLKKAEIHSSIDVQQPIMGLIALDEQPVKEMPTLVHMADRLEYRSILTAEYLHRSHDIHPSGKKPMHTELQLSGSTQE